MARAHEQAAARFEAESQAKLASLALQHGAAVARHEAAVQVLREEHLAVHAEWEGRHAAELSGAESALAARTTKHAAELSAAAAELAASEGRCTRHVSALDATEAELTALKARCSGQASELDQQADELRTLREEMVNMTRAFLIRCMYFSGRVPCEFGKVPQGNGLGRNSHGRRPGISLAVRRPRRLTRRRSGRSSSPPTRPLPPSTRSCASCSSTCRTGGQNPQSARRGWRNCCSPVGFGLG